MEVQEPYNLFAQQKRAYYDSPQAHGQAEVPEKAQVVANPGVQPVTVPTQQIVPTQTTPAQKPAPVNTTPQKTAPIYTGGSDNPQEAVDYLASLYTSPQEEERLRKASVANQRIMAVGDALRHIGNIVNTVNYAPAQKFNSPVEEERNRYLQERARRDKRNQLYMSYQQAKAAQDARMKQLEAQMQYNREKDARDYELKKHESDARANLNEARMQRYQTQMELDQARRDGIISDNEWRKRRAELYPALTQSQIARNNRTGGGRSGGSRSGGSNMPDYEVVTENTLNDDGRVISQKKTRTVKRDGQSATSTRTTNRSNVSSFSIRNNNAKDKKKTNVGSFSIHK